MHTVCNMFSLRAIALGRRSGVLGWILVAFTALALGGAAGCIANPTPHPGDDAGTLTYGGGRYQTNPVGSPTSNDDDGAVDPATRPGEQPDAVMGDSVGNQGMADAGCGAAPEEALEGGGDAGPPPDAAGGDGEGETTGESAGGAGAAAPAFDSDPDVEW